jgi:CRP/FNR family cyclic AMP-dependent transcriptional regulator
VQRVGCRWKDCPNEYGPPNSSEKRLARVLLLMVNFGKDGKPEPVIAKISQETLAEMISTTRSRVSLFMNKFRKVGFIKYNGAL